MSYWTYVHGVLEVEAPGRTQAEKRYILDTVLAHLPNVTGSESDMNVYVLQKAGYNESCNVNEFGEFANNLSYEDHRRVEMQSQYLIVVDAKLRDRFFKDTMREFSRWLSRFAKRLLVCRVSVHIAGYDINVGKDVDYEIYREDLVELFETPSWMRKDGVVAWYEYLMWDYENGSSFPAKRNRDSASLREERR